MGSMTLVTVYSRRRRTKAGSQDFKNAQVDSQSFQRPTKVLFSDVGGRGTRESLTQGSQKGGHTHKAQILNYVVLWYYYGTNK